MMKSEPSSQLSWLCLPAELMLSFEKRRRGVKRKSDPRNQARPTSVGVKSPSMSASIITCRNRHQIEN